MANIDAAGAAIYFETAGAGEPIVLIPGFASGLWSWFCQADLAKHLRVITFDPRGIGRSLSAVTGELSIKTFAEDVLGTAIA